MEKLSLKQAVLALCFAPCLTSVVQINAGKMSADGVVPVNAGKAPAVFHTRKSGKKAQSVFEKVSSAALRQENAALRQDIKAHDAWFAQNVETENRRLAAITEANVATEVASAAITRANANTEIARQIIANHNAFAQAHNRVVRQNNWFRQYINGLATRIATTMGPVIDQHNQAIAENNALKQENAALKVALVLAHAN